MVAQIGVVIPPNDRTRLPFLMSKKRIHKMMDKIDNKNDVEVLGAVRKRLEDMRNARKTKVKKLKEKAQADAAEGDIYATKMLASGSMAQEKEKRNAEDKERKATQQAVDKERKAVWKAVQVQKDKEKTCTDVAKEAASKKH
jgi:hypothetical protein